MERSNESYEKRYEMSNIDKVYMSLLIDAVTKKEQLLEQLILETIKQNNCMKDDDFLEDKYYEIYDLKSKLIAEIEKIDDGFESIYQKVREEMQGNQYEYEQEIKKIQVRIREIMDRTVKLQKLEQDNKFKFDAFIKRKSNQVKTYSANKKSAATYYKNMMKQFKGESVFYDRTK